jgi:hypothetical protein
MKRHLWLAVSVAVALLFAVGLAGCRLWEHEEHPTGAEHPTAREEHREHPGTTHEEEHPTGAQLDGSPAEHPTTLARFESRDRVMLAAREHPAEHPETSARPERKPLTVQDVANGIERYIKRDSRLKGGYFLFYDKEQEKPLVLTLDKVHRERLAKTAPHTFFACSDFAAPHEDGKLYDLDFWIKEQQTGEMTVTEIMVHKEAGQPRYTWHEVGGTWKRRPVD